MRSAISSEAQRLLEIRWDAIMNLADDFGYAAATSWANSASPDRVAVAIAHNKVWVAELDSMVVGWIEAKDAMIKALYVHPVYSRLGVGSLLLAYAESAIYEQGNMTVHLDASLSALPFYLRLGYKRIGETKPDRSVLMVKYLDGDV